MIKPHIKKIFGVWSCVFNGTETRGRTPSDALKTMKNILLVRQMQNEKKKRFEEISYKQFEWYFNNHNRPML